MAFGATRSKRRAPQNRPAADRCVALAVIAYHQQLGGTGRDAGSRGQQRRRKPAAYLHQPRAVVKQDEVDPLQMVLMLVPFVRRHRSSFCEAPGVPSLGSSCTSRQHLGDGGD